MFLFENVTEEEIENLSPNDVLEVYHGTTLSQIPRLINGFDANEITPRHYGGPRHRGLYVAPNFSGAFRFGSVVMKLLVRAKFLHGVDWSGNIGRDKKEDWSWTDEIYPNSFRPHLSHTLLDKGEPQALLRGLVSPKQIKEIYYKDEWYTRKEFIELELETQIAPHPRKGGGSYSKKSKIQDVNYDLSSTSYSLEKYLEIINKLTGGRKTLPSIKDSLLRALSYENNELQDLLLRLGFGETASNKIINLLKTDEEKIETIKEELKKYFKLLKVL